MENDKFFKIAESLKQYRRAELQDFTGDLGNNPLDCLYVDPLESDSVLKTVTQNSTTFLVGRKGTGKSTVFAKAQAELRKRKDAVSVYIDVKTLNELLAINDIATASMQEANISPSVYFAHRLRKRFLTSVISELISELKKAYESQSLIAKWTSKKRGYADVISELVNLGEDVKAGGLTSEELPILQVISTKAKEAAGRKDGLKSSVSASAKGGAGVEASVASSVEAFDESMSDTELYQDYADVVLRSLPFNELLGYIQELLIGAGLRKLFIFFDDFSELSLLEQRLFVDVILAPLNNASNEYVKLKVAGYPGRIYYGRIDPGKIDTLGLDFYSIYRNVDIQTSEGFAVGYTKRLLDARFKAFDANFSEFFDDSTTNDDYFRLIFELTMNVPRTIGYVLHNCYLDRISRGQKITPQALRLAAQKHYDSVLSKYFDRMNRFAMEPFERKLDRHNQHELLKCVVREAKGVRRGITAGEIGGKYFEGLSNPQVSHFAVSPNLESVLSPLELNFIVTKYHEMRDKDGNDVSIYALSYGLCESERLAWGYPRGRRDDRSYFVQRCFNYTATVKEFLSQNRTIRCKDCGASFDMDKKDMIELYKWRCPDCQTGVCSVVTLNTDFATEIEALDRDIMLPPVELEILETLNDEDAALRANEIAQIIDTTYQMVGKRTSKLKDMGLVDKKEVDGANRSLITDKARRTYFTE